MSKFILALFLLSISSYLYGQYIPIVDTESNWIYLRYENNDTPNVKSGYLLRIKQDTFIENTTYKKVYQYELEGTHPCPPEMRPCFTLNYSYKTKEGTHLIGFIREDLDYKTSYYLPNGDDHCSISEYELYNFSIQTGDTLSTCQNIQIGDNQPYITGIIDSIANDEVFDLQRRTLHTTGITSYIGLPPIGDVRISEGIGFINYGLIYGQSKLDVLVDFCSDSISNCDITLSEGNIVDNMQFTLYPNPTNHKIHCESMSEIKSIHFFSINGISLNLYQNKTNIDVTHLERGFYIVRIEFGNGQMTQTSFIKY